MTTPVSPIWRTLAVALLSALLAGAGMVVRNNGTLSHVESRLAVEEEKSRALLTWQADEAAWRIRIEEKLDLLLRQWR